MTRKDIETVATYMSSKDLKVILRTVAQDKEKHLIEHDGWLISKQQDCYVLLDAAALATGTVFYRLLDEAEASVDFLLDKVRESRKKQLTMFPLTESKIEQPMHQRKEEKFSPEESKTWS